MHSSDQYEYNNTIGKRIIKEYGIEPNVWPKVSFLDLPRAILNYNLGIPLFVRLYKRRVIMSLVEMRGFVVIV